MNKKGFVKVKKTFGKTYTNCRTLFSIKRNALTDRYDKYNDLIMLQT